MMMMMMIWIQRRGLASGCAENARHTGLPSNRCPGAVQVAPDGQLGWTASAIPRRTETRAW